jgi:predicted nicotinamide N-methyase
VSGEVLRTSIGEFPLHEYRLGLGGHTWSILHAAAILTESDEARFLRQLDPAGGLPYGSALWPSSIALAHGIAARAGEFLGKRVLELGAGTGLPGIVAATFGARVVQTDRQAVAMSLCERNGARNGVEGVERRIADWTDWRDDARYDWILGADVLYAPNVHDHLRRIFARNLAPGGRVLLADPFRTESVALLEALEAGGWRVSVDKWTVGEGRDARPYGVFTLVRG